MQGQRGEPIPWQASTSDRVRPPLPQGPLKSPWKTRQRKFSRSQELKSHEDWVQCLPLDTYSEGEMTLRQQDRQGWEVTVPVKVD